MIAAIGAAVLLGSGLTACGTSGGSSGKITLSFLSYNYGTPDTGGEGTQELLDAFAKQHPDIDIRPQGVAIADALTKTRTMTASGHPPDIAQIGWSKLGSAYDSLPVTPIQDIPSQQEWASSTAGISPPLLSAVKHDGKVAAMPYTLSTPTLFYNAALFTRAGLDPAAPPTTVEQAQHDGLAIARTGASGVYFDIANASKSDFLTQSIIASNGGSLVSEDGAVTLDRPPAVEALGALAQLTRSGAQPAVGENDAISAFKAGRLGMLVTSTALLSSLEAAAKGRFDLRTAAMPGFAGKARHTTFSGAGLIVLSKDSRKRRAAWEFVKFLTSAQGFTIITSKIGYLPLRPDLITDPRYLKSYYTADPRIGPALTQLNSVTPYTYFRGKQAAQAVVMLQDDGVEPVVLRGADPAATLHKVAGEIRSLTGR